MSPHVARHLLPLLALAAMAHGLPCAAVSAQRPSAPRPSFPAVSIPNTEVRSLHSSNNGGDYDLYVYLPSRPDSAPEQKHPVLYLLDGQWDFKLLTSIQGGLLYDKSVPDVIVVGITYSGVHANYDSLRAVDYTPRAGTSNPGSGQGAQFLAFMEKELFPSRRSLPAMWPQARRSPTPIAAFLPMTLRLPPRSKHCRSSSLSRLAIRNRWLRR